MTCTSRKALRRRRIVAAALALPLSFALTGTALASGSTAELRTAGTSAAEASDKAAPKAEAPKADAKKSDSTTTGSAAGAASGKTAASTTRDSSSNPDKHGTSDTAPLNSPQPLSKADRNGTGANPGDTCTHSYCSTRDGSASGNGVGDGEAKGKPCAGCVGKADNKNPKGQYPDGSDHNAGYECDRNQGIGKTNPAHTGCTGATSEPTTPPTKKATTKPSTKPTTTPTPTPEPTKSTKGQGTADVTVEADCRTVRVTSSKDISNVVVFFKDGTSQKFDGLSGYTWTRTFTKDVSSARAKSATTSVTGTATGCGTLPTSAPGKTCPDGSAMPASGDVKDCDTSKKTTTKTCPDGSAMPASGDKKDCDTSKKTTTKTCPDGATMPASGDVKDCKKDKGVSGNAQDKVTICHATGSEKNPYVIITPSKQGVLNGHVGHQDGRDIIPSFTYVEDGVTKTFPGQGDVSLMATGCVKPDSATVPAVSCPLGVMGPVALGCPPANGGGDTETTTAVNTPISGTPQNPATGPAPVVVGPPTNVPAANPVVNLPTGVAPHGVVTPITFGSGTVAAGAAAPAAAPAGAAAPAAAPRTLPFTGTDAALLVTLGSLLLLAGSGVLVAARRERTARAI